MRNIFTNSDTTPLPTPCSSTQIAYSNHCKVMREEKDAHCEKLAAYKKLNPKCDPACLAGHLRALKVFYVRNAEQEIIKAEQEIIINLQEIIIKYPRSRPKAKKAAEEAKKAAEEAKKAAEEAKKAAEVIVKKNNKKINNYLASVGFPKKDEEKIIAALKGLAAREITRKMLEDARLKLIGVIGSFKKPPCKLPEGDWGSEDCDKLLKQKRQRNK